MSNIKNFVKKFIAVSALTFAFANANANDAFELFVTFDVKKEHFKEHFDLLKIDVVETRKEKGSTSFNMFIDEKKPTYIYLFERWKSEEAFQSHLKQKYVTDVVAVNDKHLSKPMDLGRMKKVYGHYKTYKGEYALVTFYKDKKGGFAEHFKSFYDKAMKASGVVDIVLEQGEKDKSSYMLYVLFKDKESMKNYEAHMKQEEEKFNSFKTVKMELKSII